MLSKFKFLSLFLFGFLISSPAHAMTYPAWLTQISSTVGQSLATPIANVTETTCLALTVYHEARGEPEIGQRMVAAVVMNRSRNGRYPKTVCGVVFQPGQFSFLRKRGLAPKESGSWSRAWGIASNYITRPTTEWSFLSFDSSGRRGGYRVGNHFFR